MTVRISNLTATFTNASFTYTAIGMNANVVAAGANSMLLDLKNTGNTKFKVGANGQVFISSYIHWDALAYGSPTTNTRSVGTKIVLWPQIDAVQVDYAIGIEESHTWFSVPGPASGFKWYANTTQILKANTTGLTIGAIIANGAVGTTGQALAANSTGGNYWSAGPFDNNAWTNYTPTVTAGSGSFTTLGTVIGRYKLLTLKTLALNLDIAITTNGTAASYVVASLPSGMTAAGLVSYMHGRENNITGVALTGQVAASGGDCVIWQYNNVYPGGSGYRLILSGVIEIL